MEFSFNRFWLLVRKQWAEQRGIYLVGLVALAGLMFVMGLFSITSNNTWSDAMQAAFFVALLWFSGGLVASIQFSALADKARGITQLMLPASHLEKFAVGVFYAFAVFLIAVVLTFYVVDVPLVQIARGIEQTPNVRRPPELINVFTFQFQFNELPAFELFFVFQAFALLSSIYAGQYAFVKGGLVLILLFFGGLILNTFLVQLLIDAPAASGYPFLAIDFRRDVGQMGVDTILTPEPLRTVLAYAGGLVLPLALLGIGYLRLTEKEI